VTTKIAYKFLAPGRLPCHGGAGAWPEPGVWTPRIDRLVPCLFGYHLCFPEHLHDWLGPELWRAEWRGACIDAEDKIVVEQARLLERVEAWNERTARLYACDCAERVVRLTGPDVRAVAAIAVARRFAIGEASDEEWAAARSAAEAAEGATAGATWTADAVWASAMAAATVSATASATASAASAAASAASAAASAAAMAAAAGAAALADAAADAAAWGAAWGAARDAERSWQTARLLATLGLAEREP
jgi:hypothetical protein